tara:strand:- start:247 stop:408 length:162 start_codon:yes stop_codon:yes gene_type:complete
VQVQVDFGTWASGGKADSWASFVGMVACCWSCFEMARLATRVVALVRKVMAFI